MHQNVKQFRHQKDQYMKLSPQSPIPPEQRKDFDGLQYFDYNESLALHQDVTEFVEKDEIEMQTSTGDVRPYQRWGRIEFTIEGETAALTIYSDPYHGDFFLPFKDATNGRETYGAGRYLDNHRPGLRHLQGDEFEIDFNYAYNPYCAYNENYSCPLPPAENWLKVPIRAGEKKFE